MLTDDQLFAFARDGYLVVKGVVPEVLLEDADAEIAEMVAAKPPPVGTVGHHFYFPPPTQLPMCDRALRVSGALDVANELVAPHHLDHALDHIQVALNIPPYGHRPGGPHIDCHTADQPEPGSFTMLAAIYLGDETQIDSGNLWVWPGSHLDHQRLFHERGLNALLPTSGHSTMLDPPLAVGAPTPVYAERGDLLLAHFLLGHNIGGNETDRIRRIVYYRLACENHRDRWKDTFLDVWTEYAPVRAQL
ncbi:MAG: phytanoyl-CoA dioxygenase family protein [Actinobacteria bacterium]|nr:phytanoyl-CoA dioxygenase family protein [Actinomycetota bacterium]